jgi:8-oxo-dGTP pyrophosphatase MutT (NUDIX family)
MTLPMRARREEILQLQERLRERADVPPPDDWLPVDLGSHQIGITSPETASFLATIEPACSLLDYRLVIEDPPGGAPARTALLNRIAASLRDEGIVRGWRDEQLDVRTPAVAGALATIERAACRALGIPTHAVHMNAFDDAGRLVVARRADDKPIDPGLWDNLVGGMVASGEDEMLALARETKEEAGLHLAALTVTRGGLVRERRPVTEGYMIETVQVFDTHLPVGMTPCNEDGEVAQIEACAIDDVLAAIDRGEFTLEAALVTVDALLRRIA